MILNVTVTGLVPLLNIEQGTTIYTSGASYVFDPAIQGDPGTGATFKITNSGTFRLIFDRPVLTSSFQMGYMPTFPTYLDPGESIQITLLFTPTMTGQTTGTFSFVSNADETPFILNLSGVGLDKPAHRMVITDGTFIYTVNGRIVSFSSTVKGGTSFGIPFTIINTGVEELSISDIVLSGPFELTQIFTPISIAAGSSATFEVVFKPVNIGDATGIATITSNIAGLPFILNLSGTGLTPPAPDILVGQNFTVYNSSGSAFVFPPTTQGTTSNAVVFTIRNTGDAGLSISGLTLTGPFELAQAPTYTYISGGNASTFSVVFKPVDASNVTGTAIIISNVIGSPFILNLSGTVTAPAITVSQGATAYTSNGTAYTFPATIQGSQSTSVEFTIQNTGAEILTLGIPTITGPFQLIAPSTSSVAAGSSTTFYMEFSPTTTGAFAGTVIIPNNATGSSFVLNLTGTGTLATGTTGTLDAAAIAISPNPSNGNAVLHMNGMFSNISVNVYNALGELVVANKLGSTNSTALPLLLTDAASGMYIVEVITDQGSSMKRLIKE